MEALGRGRSEYNNLDDTRSESGHRMGIISVGYIACINIWAGTKDRHQFHGQQAHNTDWLCLPTTPTRVARWTSLS